MLVRDFWKVILNLIIQQCKGNSSDIFVTQKTSFIDNPYIVECHIQGRFIVRIEEHSRKSDKDKTYMCYIRRFGVKIPEYQTLFFDDSSMDSDHIELIKKAQKALSLHYIGQELSILKECMECLQGKDPDISFG